MQTAAGNFDDETHSLNGLQQIHVLATYLVQATSVTATESRTISQLKRQELSMVKLKDIPMNIFICTKNPSKLPTFYKSDVKRLKLLCVQFIQSQLSSEKDCMFFKQTLTNS